MFKKTKTFDNVIIDETLRVKDIISTGTISGTISGELELHDEKPVFNSEKTDLITPDTPIGIKWWLDGTEYRELLYTNSTDIWTIDRNAITMILAGWQTGNYVLNGVAYVKSNDGELQFNANFLFDDSTNTLTIPKLTSLESITHTDNIVINLTGTNKEIQIKNSLSQNKHRFNNTGTYFMDGVNGLIQHTSSGYLGIKLGTNNDFKLIDNLSSNIISHSGTGAGGTTSFLSNLDSTSTSTGGIVLYGGLGLAKNLHLGKVLHVDGDGQYDKKIDFKSNNDYLRLDSNYNGYFSNSFTFNSDTNAKCLTLEANEPVTIIGNHKTEGERSTILLCHNPTPTTSTGFRGYGVEYESNTAPSNDNIYSSTWIGSSYKFIDIKEIDDSGFNLKHLQQAGGLVVYPNKYSSMHKSDFTETVFKILSNSDSYPTEVYIQHEHSTTDNFTPVRLRFRNINNTQSFQWYFETEDNNDGTTNFTLNNTNLAEVLKFYENARQMQLKGTYNNGSVEFILRNDSATNSNVTLRLQNDNNNANVDCKIETCGSSNSICMFTGYSSFNISSWCSVPFFQVTQTGTTAFSHYLPLTSGSSDLDVNFNSSTNLVYYVSSTKKDKYDIKTFDIPTKKIFEKLKLRSYKRYSDKKTPHENRKEIGLILEEFESAVKQEKLKNEKEVLNYFISYEKKCPKGFRSGAINYLLFDRVKEMQKDIDMLTDKNKKQDTIIKKSIRKIETLNSKLKECMSKINKLIKFQNSLRETLKLDFKEDDDDDEISEKLDY